MVDGAEKTALACRWVTDGIDQCCVGFLPKHCLRHAALYEGKLVQVIKMYKDSDSPSKRERCHKNKGACLAAHINSVETDTKATSKNRT